MINHWLLAIAFTTLTLFTTTGMTCPVLPNGTTTYPLMCRGKIGVEQKVTPGVATIRLHADFIKNPTSSGITGEKLQVGSCAWVDRPLSATEPSNFARNVVGHLVGEDFPSQHAAQLIEHCAEQSDCVFEFCTYSYTDGGLYLLWSQDNWVKIRYPHF